MEKEYEEIGKINVDMLKRFFSIKTDRLIITTERIEHINERHNNDYNLYGRLIPEIIENPHYILKDIMNKNTVLYLKTIKELNLQIVVKLQTESNVNKANSVITFWHMRKRSYVQIIKKNEKIFEKTRQK